MTNLKFPIKPDYSLFVAHFTSNGAMKGENNENEIATLEDKLCQQTTYNDKNLVIEINEQLQRLNTELEDLYEIWSDLTEE